MLTQKTIDNIIDAAMQGGDFAEVFCETNRHSTIECSDDRLETSSTGIEAGVGIRIFSGFSTIYAYTNSTAEDDLLALARQAARALKEAYHPRAPLALLRDYTGCQLTDIPPDTVPYKDKLAVVRRALSAGKAYSSEIARTHVRYLDTAQQVQIANSEGIFATDMRTKTRILISAHASGPEGLQTGYIGPGAMQGFEFYNTLDVEETAREAARMAVTMLHAAPCPGGVMPVVVQNGFGGLLFHEACGHSLEASSVAKGLSEFSGRVGQQVASPVVTLVDDGSIAGEWGSLNIDDEGTTTQRNVLIENGVLKGYLVDRMGSRRLGLPITGSARRQSYRFAPTSRMTNTFIQAGQSRRDELIANTEKGLYVHAINGGSVNPATGDFNFAAAESYLIENGRITTPVKGATLIGNGGDILQKVDMVADNLDIRQGYCFAASGALYIGAGQPTVRVAGMTVGGA